MSRRKRHKAFLWLAIFCARCHGHKHDPIVTRDYYPLYRVLQSTRQRPGPRDARPKLTMISVRGNGSRIRPLTQIETLKFNIIRLRRHRDLALVPAMNS
jgi:hypothetical protein